jgi:hypothetical protein
MKSLLALVLFLSALALVSVAIAEETSRSGILPKQETQTVWLTATIRSYYTTTKDGQKKLVVTNLDENGNRIGPPPPPMPEPSNHSVVREVYVPVESYLPEPQYAEDRQFRHPFDEVAYYDPYFIPDYPGNTFGFHLLPQFVRIQPPFRFVRRSFPRHRPHFGRKF